MNCKPLERIYRDIANSEFIVDRETFDEEHALSQKIRNIVGDKQYFEIEEHLSAIMEVHQHASFKRGFSHAMKLMLECSGID